MFGYCDFKDDDGNDIVISASGYIRISDEGGKREYRRILDVYGPVRVTDSKHQVRIGYFDTNSKDNVKDVYVSFGFDDFANQFIANIIGRA